MVMGSQPIRIQLWKILREILAGNSCGTRRRGKSQFKKGSDSWKLSIWNRVMGSKPIRIQLGKILQKNLAGKSCGKILHENLVGKSCRKILWEILREILAGNLAEKSCRKSCGKILWEIFWDNLAGNSPYLSPNHFWRLFSKYAIHLDLPHFHL